MKARPILFSAPMTTNNGVRCCAVTDDKQLAEKFWSLIERSAGMDACWPWKGKLMKRGGYGAFNARQKPIKAHRFAYELTFGPLPSTVLVRHVCDNPPCCNPAHLLPGTFADNARDAMERDRVCFGSRQHAAKLKEGQVLIVRSLLASGLTQREVAERFGVNQSTISDIAKGVTWRRLRA